MPRAKEVVKLLVAQLKLASLKGGGDLFQKLSQLACLKMGHNNRVKIGKMMFKDSKLKHWIFKASLFSDKWTWIFPTFQSQILYLQMTQ